MNLTDWLLLAGIVVLAFFAVRYAFRHRHESCGGECSSCPYRGNCGKKPTKE